MDLLQFFHKQKYCDILSSHTVICDLLTVEEQTDRDREEKEKGRTHAVSPCPDSYYGVKWQKLT